MFLMIALNFALSLDAKAQQIIVEATRISANKIEDSRSVTVIDDNFLKTKKASSLAEVLREIPGVEVLRQGPIGQTTSVFIRGARSEDTLVLVDGIEVNDTSSPAGGFDFSVLSAIHIVKIEVYRGPQSVRFGAGALGGVINIITKEGQGPFRTDSMIEVGSYNTRRGATGISGKSKDLSYSLAIEKFKTDGFSAANEKYGNTEKDGAETGTASSKLIWHFNPGTKIETSMRYQNSKVDLDNGGGIGADDPNNISKANHLVLGIVGHKRFFKERLKSKLGFYQSKIKRFNQNEPDTNSNIASTDNFEGENKKIETDHEFSFLEFHRLRLDLQWRNESGQSQSVFNTTPTEIEQKNQSTMGEALTYLYDDENWFGDLGYRLDQHSVLGSIPSYRASLGKAVFDRKTKISATYGTGFKPPSLYNLYSVYGNQNLKHETSNATEFNVQRRFNEKIFISATYFRNYFNNRIDYDIPSQHYFNISKVKSSGFEVQSSFHVHSNLKISGQYSYLETLNENTGQQLIRIPKNTWRLATYYTNQNLESYVQYRYRGNRTDFDQVTNRLVTQSSYSTFDLGGAYRLSKSTQLTGRIENLLNQVYEEVAGFGTAGFSLFFGLAVEI